MVRKVSKASDPQQALIMDLRAALRRMATKAEEVIDVFCLDEHAEKEEEAAALQALRDEIAEVDS